MTRSLSRRGPEHLADYTRVGCAAAFRRSTPLDRIAPALPEHRDCPPCGGDVLSIAQVRGGGDGSFSIPQFAEVSGLIWLGLGLWNSAGLCTGLADPHLSSPLQGEGL